MALKAGTVADFEDSLAEAMEKAMEIAWPKVKGQPLPEVGQEDRRLLFVAIAQGILRYLQDNTDALIVHDVTVTQDAGNNVTSSNASGTVTVTQDGGSSNRVQSEGDGKFKLDITGELY
jgi:hypothetical protein